MKNVTLKFTTLQLMADCMFQLGLLTRPVIDYEKYLLTASMTDKQIEIAKGCNAEIVAIIVLE